MKSYLHQLDGNEAILLMYLAGELPLEDRNEVEQMLAVDAGLRNELDSLRQLHDVSLVAIEKADHHLQTPIPESLAARQVVRMMNQRKLQARAHPPKIEPARRYSWWVYASSSAAAAVFVFALWTVYRPVSSNLGPLVPVPQVASEELSPQEKAIVQSFALADADDSNLKLLAVANKPTDTDFVDMPVSAEGNQ